MKIRAITSLFSVLALAAVALGSMAPLQPW